MAENEFITNFTTKIKAVIEAKSVQNMSGQMESVFKNLPQHIQSKIEAGAKMSVIKLGEIIDKSLGMKTFKIAIVPQIASKTASGQSAYDITTMGFSQATGQTRPRLETIASQQILVEDLTRKQTNTSKAAGVEVKNLDKAHKNLSFTVGNMLKKSATIVPIWMAIRNVYMSVFSLIQNSMRFLVEWETTMASIAVVGGGTKEQLNNLSDALLGLGSAMGTSMKDLGEGARLWAQQGKSYSEIIPLMKTTASLSKITGRSMTESVEDITSVMKSFNMTAEDSMKIVDSLVAIDLKFAITTDVLVAAVKKVGPVASQMNISFEKLLGVITATHVATRASGDEIGNAWRTIFTRMTTQSRDAIQSLADIPVYIDKFGTATKENTGSFRSWEDILDELAIKYKNLNDTNKAALAEALSGTRQISKMMSAFQHWGEGMDASLAALLSYGKGQNAINILLDTAESKTKKLENSWLRLVEVFLSTDAYKQVLDFLDAFVQKSEKFFASRFFKQFYGAGMVGMKDLSTGTSQIGSLLAGPTGFKSAGGNNLTEKITKLDETQQIIQNRALQEELGKVSEEYSKQINMIDAYNKALDQKKKITEQLRVAEKTGNKEAVKELEERLNVLNEAINAPNIKALGNIPSNTLALRAERLIKENEIKKRISYYAGNAQEGASFQEQRDKAIALYNSYKAEGTAETEKKLKEFLMGVTGEGEGGAFLGKKQQEYEFARLEALKDYGVQDSEINRRKLEYLAKFTQYEDEDIVNVKDKLKEEEKINEQKEKYDEYLRSEELYSKKLVAYGVSNLQIEIALLAKREEYLRSIGENVNKNEEIIKQKQKILELTQEEINSYSEGLKSVLSENLTGLLGGDTTLEEAGTNLAESVKDTVLSNFSSSLMSEIFGSTGLGQVFGETVLGIKNLFSRTPTNLYEAGKFGIQDGADYFYEKAKEAIKEGTDEANEGTGEGGTGGDSGSSALKGIGAAISAGMIGYSAYKNAGGGVKGGIAGFMGFGGGLLSSMGGSYGTVGKLLVVGSMMFGMAKKQVEVAEEISKQTQQIASKIQLSNKELSVVNRNLVALRQEKTFILPESAYFSTKNTIEDEFALHSSRGLA